MGCICPGPSDPDKRINQEIIQGLKTLQNEDNQIKKLLLLGCGSSGKSTIFKQLKNIHGENIEEKEKEEYIHVIRQNLVTGILTILRKSHYIYELNPELYKDCKIDFERPDIASNIGVILEMPTEFNDDNTYSTENLNELGAAIYNLWQLQPIKRTYAKRGDHYSFPDNMDYFFNKVIDIMQLNYVPSFEDILKARLRTTGLIEYTFHYGNKNENAIKICDVGGQRNERKKWIHSFDQVTAVIFVAGLDHYNSVLFEDEKKNAMHESLDLFSEICNNKYFRKTEMILFLNKADLFRIKLQEGFSLKNCFSAACGWMGLQWDGPDYDPNDETKTLELCYNSAINFIQTQYVELNDSSNKAIFVHVTTATDQDNVKKVFWDVQSIVIRANLHNAQLI